jgi:DNA-binding MarR family transcriptional regulator
VRDQFQSGKIVLENALAFAVYHAYQRLRTALYREFHGHGLDITPEQWMVLVRLWAEDGIAQSVLCDRTLRDRPTMTRILDTMEGSGLVVRRPHPDDGRSRLVFLTREAKALEKRLVPLAAAMVDRLEAGIPARDLEITRRTLRRIVENMS